jgi:hypothetical protein
MTALIQTMYGDPSDADVTENVGLFADAMLAEHRERFGAVKLDRGDVSDLRDAARGFDFVTRARLESLANRIESLLGEAGK